MKGCEQYAIIYYFVNHTYHISNSTYCSRERNGRGSNYYIWRCDSMYYIYSAYNAVDHQEKKIEDWALT